MERDLDLGYSEVTLSLKSLYFPGLQNSGFCYPGATSTYQYWRHVILHVDTGMPYDTFVSFPSILTLAANKIEKNQYHIRYVQYVRYVPYLMVRQISLVRYIIFYFLACRIVWSLESAFTDVSHAHIQS